MRSIIGIWAAMATLIVLAALPATAQSNTWPRVIDGPQGGRITLYQPQIDLWEDFASLDFRVAAEIIMAGRDIPIPAALRLRASTTTDLEQRTVTAYDLMLIDMDVPGADEAVERRLKDRMETYIAGKTQTVSMDTLLAHLVSSGDGVLPEVPSTPVDSIERPRELLGPTPVILVNTQPSVLVLFDGEPIFAEIEGTGLEFAINTNWDILHHKASSSYYLLNDDAWLKAPAATGPWAPAGKLPKAFSDIPQTDGFKLVRQNVPGKPISKQDVPRVFVSYKPAELIVLDGKPVAKAIPGTDLAWISNTQSDLFRHTASEDYYYLVSGRWFRASSLTGPWSPASRDLPDSFSDIPTDHPVAHVRVSVPGTAEAEEAVMLATLPQKAEVKRKDTTVDVTYYGEPDFQKIEGTTIYYAANTSYDVFRVGVRYYTCFRGVWFVSSTPRGVWAVSTSVPAAIYTIPISSPKYHVTHVYVYDATPDVVVVGYTRGYRGVYVSNGVVVYGTGYYYAPYVYYPPYGYPVYRAYPHSYGAAAVYNPYTGAYGRGTAVYGPYGGAGWGAAYNPSTGTYARGVSAVGPYEAGRAGQAYNPRTDTYAAGYQRSNSYASWGESVVTRGDDWVRTAKYSDARGSAAGIETSQGASAGFVQTDQGTAYVGRDADNNLYAGRDGNVYRRDDNGWSSYNDGDWQSVDRSATANDRIGDRQRSGERNWSDRSAGTFETLERDRQARDSASRRSKDRDSWRNNRQSRSSSRGSRSRGSRRRN